MRMRKLGKGQSVAFCSSMEVQRKIVESSGKMYAVEGGTGRQPSFPEGGGRSMSVQGDCASGRGSHEHLKDQEKSHIRH
jgi:hypothetical protein